MAQVVIVGGGFAGLAAARRLSGAPVDVVLVDQHNFHTFQPLLYQVATAGLDEADVAYPIRAALRRAPNIRFVHARVESFDLAARRVELEDGTTIGYDQLVVASGAAAAFFGVPGAAEHALSLYTLDDAHWVRNTILAALERAERHADSRGPAPGFVVVGGGPTGVETTGALVELLDIAARHDHPALGGRRPPVVLLDAQQRLLPGFGRRASAYAESTLRSRGVDVRLGAQVAAVTSAGVRLADGADVPAEVVIWVAGVSVTGTLASRLPGPRAGGGRTVVGADLSLADHPEVFVAGDAAAIVGPTAAGRASRQGPPAGPAALLPQVAQVAIQSGDHAGRQILRRLEGRETIPFSYRDKGLMATVGRRAAIAQLPRGAVVDGTAGWLAWLALHLVYLIGFRNRAVVLVNWAWRYLRWPSGPRLIIGEGRHPLGDADLTCPECRQGSS